MSAAVFYPDDDDARLYVPPTYDEDAVPRAPWEDDAEAAERELNAPLAPWEEFVPLAVPPLWG